MWNDNESLEDLIDFTYLRTSINEIISQDDLLPATIGVFGDWGSGKSSLIKMLESDHIKNKDELVVKFNGWLFESYEDAKVALLETLIEEIIQARKWDETAIKYISRLLKRVKWLKTITTVGKFGLGMYLNAQSGIPIEAFGINNKPFDKNDYIEEKTDEKQEIIDKGLKEFHKDFAKLIKETGLNRIIVIIDDLDRCTPATVIATLEAIKLFLFVDKTVFIIAADERLINYAVKSRFPNLPSSDYDVSQDYLEKLIQIPVRIPSLNSIEYETYINFLFLKKHLSKDNFDEIRSKIFLNSNDPYSSKLNFDNHNIFIKDPTEGLKEDLLLTTLLNPLLVQILRGNPRQCKRFLNMLIMRINMSKAKGIILKKVVMAKLMLLEYFKPESFNLLAKELNSNNDIIEILEDKKSKVPDNLNIFRTDEWTKHWLSVDPKLATEDLQDYFYFIRSKILEIKQNKRLSKEAKEILADMLDADLLSKAAIKRSKALLEEDKMAILEELFEKYLKEEVDKARSRLSVLISNYVEQNQNLVSEYYAFLENLPLKSVVSTMIPHIITVTKLEELKPTQKVILTKWANCDIKAISTAAKSKLSKL